MKKIALMLLFLTLDAQIKQPSKNEPEKPFDQLVYDWSRTFAEMLETTQKKHYQIKNAQNSFVQAFNCFLNKLDPHSNFLGPEATKNIFEKTTGSFFGIGIVIDNTRNANDKYLTIVDTIPEGPADKAGIKPLDKIIEIEGETLQGMSTEEATSKLKGERNTKVHIKVMREDVQDPIPFDITRDEIKEQSSLSFYLPDHNIYYLSLTMFSRNSAKQIEELLKKSADKKARALILDLRNNSGGLLDSAIDIVGLFTKKGDLVVTTKNNKNQETGRYNTTREPIADLHVPIFILINNYTASAAEILAGCLKLHSQQLAQKQNNQKQLMVFLVGTKTFGKGSVQEVIPVSNNSAIKITTSLYFLPGDITIQGVGIQPDFEVERQFPPSKQVEWFEKHYGREQTLNNYIKVNNNNEEKKKKAKEENKHKSWSERAKERLQQDNQLREAISLVNLYHLSRNHCPTEVCNRTKAVEFMNKQHVTNNELNMNEVKV